MDLALRLWLGSVLLTACHAAPSAIDEQKLVPPAGPDCSAGFQLANRMLGEAFTLHALVINARETSVLMTPADFFYLREGLWHFEPVPAASDLYYVINLGQPDLILSNTVELVARAEEEDNKWRIEAVPNSDGSKYFSLRPQDRGGALGTTVIAPYDPLIRPERDHLSQQWRFLPVMDCSDAGTGELGEPQ